MPTEPGNIFPERISLLAEARTTVRKLLDRVSLVALTLGLVSTTSSMLRIRTEGMMPNVVVDMFFYPAIALVVIFRKKLKDTAALALLVGITTVNACLNFITLGLVSVSFLILATCAIITLSVFGRRKGYLYLWGSIVMVLLVWLGHTLNVFPDVSLSPGYLDAPGTWIMQLTTYMVFTIVMLVTVDNIQVRLAEVLNRQVRQSATLEEREEKYRLLTENMSDVVFVQDMDMNITYCSPSVEHLCGYTPDEMLSMRMDKMLTPESVERVTVEFGDAVQRAMAGGKAETLEIELEYIRKDGSTFTGACRGTFVRNQDGSLAGIQGIMMDISGRKRAEQALHAALKEKDVLLKELFHRTKNNMQVIHSMLSVQSSFTTDAKALDLFRDVQGRIQAMALVHQKLYTSQSLSSINLAEYVRELYALLGRSYRGNAARAVLRLDIGPLPVSFEVAIPCGLVLNELITNSFKYAFPDGRAGQVSVAANRDADDVMVITYADNGVGIPDGFDFRATGTLGMQVMYGIVEHQLQGSIECSGTDGFTCTIRFRDPVGEKRGQDPAPPSNSRAG